ncbi:PEP-CTERM/exosortase system-associated acyltransferase [Neiella sp. HB171785]|uniref:PEP-CTERM/exosortase system-associated acyltransferase n=1 Tax=Neiella litorisoli TaxID=2771431 RepID=A0A8J6QM04_9GAMM|nr:PEP-CTERM/exosortase system-associated acyltransferase [Neiella litorisoli]MBD1390581.1 PEP-CTERM/exosortase system-associated acyltransferase [Neiella litorisoli]
MNRKLRRLAQLPVIGKIISWGGQLLVSREGRKIAKHFSKFLKPVVAYHEETVNETFRIRHQVYCEELEFEDPRPEKMEKDDFDRFSRYCLIQRKQTSDHAGTIRIVSPQNDDELLPIEKYCQHALEGADLKPSDFNRNEVCEMSRLAVPASYRRRQMDKYKGAATGVINEGSYSKEELRCFPFLAIGLYLAGAALAIRSGNKHCFVMMEPRLARSMAFIGVKFKQLGPAVDYHGIRAPYYINAEMLHASLPRGFKRLFAVIDKEIEKQREQARLEAMSPSEKFCETQKRMYQ